MVKPIIKSSSQGPFRKLINAANPKKMSNNKSCKEMTEIIIIYNIKNIFFIISLYHSSEYIILKIFFS